MFRTRSLKGIPKWWIKVLAFHLFNCHIHFHKKCHLQLRFHLFPRGLLMGSLRQISKNDMQARIMRQKYTLCPYYQLHEGRWSNQLVNPMYSINKVLWTLSIWKFQKSISLFQGNWCKCTHTLFLSNLCLSVSIFWPNSFENETKK